MRTRTPQTLRSALNRPGHMYVERDGQPKAEPLAFLAPRPDQKQEWLKHERNPITLDAAIALVNAANERDGVRTDKIVDLKACGFGSLDHATMQLADMIQNKAYSLREHAFSQVASTLRVPAPYVRGLPENLAIANMNWALSQLDASKPSLFRMAGDDVRAIVSDRYAACDDSTLLEIVDGILHKQGLRADAMVRSTAHGPITNLRITIPGEGVQVARGDTIEWGVDIGNSELGLRSVQVTPVTYRLVCTNGLRAWESDATTRMRHVGDSYRIRETLRAVIPTAFAEARGDIGKWRKSVDIMIDNALAEIEGLRGFGLGVAEARTVGRTLLNLPESTSDKRLEEHLKNHRVSVFEVANAVTQTARDRVDVAARLTLEETGHRYLTKRAA
jgi:hypothetical protein